MPIEHRQPDRVDGALAGEFRALQRFAGSGSEFWRRLCGAYAKISGASRVLVIRQQPESNGDWEQVALYSDQRGRDTVVQLFLERSRQLATVSLTSSGAALETLEPGPTSRTWIGVVRLKVAGAPKPVVAAVLIECDARPDAENAIQMLELVADLPERWQEQRALLQARSDVERISRGVDLQLELNGHTKFGAAGLALCNVLASTHQFDRVSLGWLERDIIRLRAMSRAEKINRKMEASQSLEAAMEEAFDQDADVVYPGGDDSGHVLRDHERYASEQRVVSVCSLPLKHNGRNVAVVTCERRDGTIQELSVKELRFSLDVVSTRLAELHERDRWFGARWMAELKRLGSGLVGHEHTWAKLIAVAVTGLLAVSIFWQVDYRIEGTFRLRSERVAVHSVPFDGFIADAGFRPGDIVEEGDLLVALDVRDLRLEQAAAVADERRFLSEVEKHRAGGNLADMRIAMSQLDQTRARLERLEHRLDLASIRSMLSGVIVEGDLRDRLGAPVSQGDGLLKVAQLADLFVEAEIAENDVHMISEGVDGEIAFVSQPQIKFPVRLIRIEPMAVPGADGNQFIVRCQMEGTTAEWWRPGMTGTVKLDAGRRSWIWIGTHRTIDFLRMFFWW